MKSHYRGDREDRTEIVISECENALVLILGVWDLSGDEARRHLLVPPSHELWGYGVSLEFQRRRRRTPAAAAGNTGAVGRTGHYVDDINGIDDGLRQGNTWCRMSPCTSTRRASHCAPGRATCRRSGCLKERLRILY